jgi:hypothetical protein
MNKTIFIVAVSVIAGVFFGLSCKSGPTAPNGAKALTAFSFNNPSVSGVINDSAKTIIVNLSDTSTDVSALVAVFKTTGASVTVGGAAQVSGTTPNNFTNPVVYTVKGADNSVAAYTIIVMKPPQWNAFSWTGVGAPTGWISHNGIDTFTTVTNGILSFNTGDTLTNKANYQYYFSSPNPPAGWKMSLIFKARDDGDTSKIAWTLDFQNDFRGQLEIRNGRVRLIDGIANDSTALASDTLVTTTWHTYFVTYEITGTNDSANTPNGLKMNVYIDGAKTPALSGIATTVSQSGYIRLGDMSNTRNYAGSLYWILWSLNGAFVPGVTLPSGYSL